MKRFSIIFFLMTSIVTLSMGQNYSYGVNIGYCGGIILNKALDGGPSYDLNNGYLAGINYNRNLNSKLGLMTGLTFYKNKVSVTPAFYPGLERIPQDYDIKSTLHSHPA